MKRILTFALLLALGFDASASVWAAKRVVVRRGPHKRAVVVVHKGWPLRRPLRTVVVRPARVAVRVAPVVFLAPIVWRPVVVPMPAPDVLAWEDAETIYKDEDWTEITLTADSGGRKLYLQIAAGKAQLDWAEVVFENGHTQVVDLGEKTRGQGLYVLLDFKDGRKVDHVRLVARAKSDEARVVLRMEK